MSTWGDSSSSANYRYDPYGRMRYHYERGGPPRVEVRSVHAMELNAEKIKEDMLDQLNHHAEAVKAEEAKKEPIYFDPENLWI